MGKWSDAAKQRVRQLYATGQLKHHHSNPTKNRKRTLNERLAMSAQRRASFDATHPDLDQNIARLIAEGRTQTEVASMLGVSLMTMYRRLNGDWRATPGPRAVAVLADYDSTKNGRIATRNRHRQTQEANAKRRDADRARRTDLGIPVVMPTGLGILTEELAWEYYDRGYSSLRIRRLFGCDAQHVLSKLRKHPQYAALARQRKREQGGRTSQRFLDYKGAFWPMADVARVLDVPYRLLWGWLEKMTLEEAIERAANLRERRKRGRWVGVSGERSVWKHEYGWCVGIYHKGLLHYVGIYKTINEAVVARDEARMLMQISSPSTKRSGVRLSRASLIA